MGIEDTKSLAGSPASPLFGLGRVAKTREVAETLTDAEILAALARHATGDWGEIEAEDWQANEEALHFGARILSVYRGENSERFWVITEADRSVTTVLFPHEY